MVRSQRVMYVVLVAISFVIVGALAFAGGHPLLVSGDTLNGKIASVIAPLLGVLGLTAAFLSVINARVAAGTLKAGDLAGVFTLSEFWVTLVATISAELQMFGFEVLNPDTQTLVVDFGVGLVAILIAVLSDREPGNDTTTQQSVLKRVQRE